MLRNKYLNRYESQKEISIPSEEKEFLVYDENKKNKTAKII